MSNTKRPAPFVLLSSNHGTLITNRNDYRMIDSQRGFGVGYQLFNQGCFDPEEIDIALKLLNIRHQHFGNGVVGLDCGANIGVHTIEWAKALHNRGSVIAFEAQERVYYALAGNIAINNCFNARALHAALGADEGSLDIPVPNYLQPASFGSLELRQSAKSEFIGQTIDPANNQKVRMVSIDSLQLTRIDFMKIDVEGMELEVLAGARASIAKHKPAMMIESIKTDKTALMQFLTERDYKTFQIGINVLAVHSQDPTLQQISTQP
jgi:FkbM family methyltransferase